MADEPKVGDATKKAAGGAALVLIGGAAAYYGRPLARSDAQKNAVTLAGLAAAGVGLYFFVSGISDAIDEVKGLAETSGGVFGALGKLIFGEKAAGTIEKSEATTLPANTLGPSKNRLGLVGAIISPSPGDTVSRQLFADGYEIKVAVATVGDTATTAPAKISVHEESFLRDPEDSNALTEVVTLEPGKPEKILTLRTPAVLGVTVPFASVDVTVRLYLAGYLLDKITFSRE